jgi:hypothetical protein
MTNEELAAQNLLADQLAYDVTGQMANAGLTFDQRVQYSIAMSLKDISDYLEKRENHRE